MPTNEPAIVSKNALRRNRVATREPRLDREDWVRAARAALIDGGIDRVKVAPLADALGVTTGSFYWHFADRLDLLQALLGDWEVNNTRAFEAVGAADCDADTKYHRIVDIWLREDDFSPSYDSAVRDWARIAHDTADAVNRVDQRRLEIMHRIFVAMGDPEPDATVRARIVYFHQVGYYAMQIRQPLSERRALLGTYNALLLGRLLG